MPRYAELAGGRALVVRATACCFLPWGYSLRKLPSPARRAALTQAAHRHEVEPDTLTLSYQELVSRRLLSTTWKVRGQWARTLVLFTCVVQALRTVPKYIVGAQ